ncbi:MAG TPA: DUF177 domain-containing protein [Nitrospiraceae bacterium]|nr:DUF177 domain-containing protein [Nitrospiraceae bacterium]
MIGNITGVMTVAKLSVQVTDIPEEGLDLADEVEPDEIDLLPEDAQVSGPLALSARLTNTGDHVYVEGVIDGSFTRECVRCLKRYQAYAEVPFTAAYRVSDPTARSRGRATKDHRQESDEERGSEAFDQEDDVYTCTGDRVELAEMLREHIILSTPMQLLCHEECRGLCPVCGQDRNEHPCHCIETPQKNPFSILQERLKNQRKAQ